jgi:hypothetical protein
MSCLIELSNLLFSIGWVHVSVERWKYLRAEKRWERRAEGNLPLSSLVKASVNILSTFIVLQLQPPLTFPDSFSHLHQQHSTRHQPTNYRVASVSPMQTTKYNQQIIPHQLTSATNLYTHVACLISSPIHFAISLPSIVLHPSPISPPTPVRPHSHMLLLDNPCS